MADAFLPYRHLKQIPAVAQVVFREFVKRNGVAAIRDISPHPPCVTIGGLPFPRTLVEAAVKRGELRKSSPKKNPTHTQTCGTCRGKGCRRCGGQGWREKNPSAATKLHGLISKGQAALRGKKNPREKMTKAELAKHQAYQVLGQHTSQCQQCAASYKTFGSFSHACPIGKALVQAASDKRRNPGAWKTNGYVYELKGKRQSWLSSSDEDWETVVAEVIGQFIGTRFIDGSKVDVVKSGSRYFAALPHAWQKSNPGFLTGAAVGLGAGAVAFTKRGRGLVASVARAGGRRTNPSFDYGSSFHEMALKSPARLSAETGASCKRCKGVGQVKLGPRMVSCPTCCRKAKKTDSSLTLQGVIRQISQEMGAARLSLRKIERQHGLDSIEWKVAAEKLAELSREHDQRVHQLRSKNLLSAKDLHTGDFDMQHYRARHDVRPHGAGRFDASGVMGVTSRQGTTEAFSSRPHKTSRAIGKLKGRSPLLSHKPNCACIYHAGKMGRKH